MSLSSDYYLISGGTSPKHLVVLLHGYGADAKNLLFLGEFFKKHTENTLFVAPNAPHKMQNTEGFMWFEVGDLSRSYLDVGVERVRPLISEFIRKIQSAYNISPQHTVISGFSQGAMLALATSLLTEDLCESVLAYSGGLYIGTHTIKTACKRACLIHGAQDIVVPKEMSKAAQDVLLKENISTECHIIPHLEHQINIEAAQIGATFIHKAFA